MKKLCHSDWEHILDVSDGKIVSLVIENVKSLRAYVEELYSQVSGETGRFVLSKDNKILKLQDSMDIITSPLSIDCQNKRIISKVSAELKSLVNSPELFSDTKEMEAALVKYAETVRTTIPYPIQFETPSPSDFLKILPFSIDTAFEDFLEKTLEYMNVMHDICGVSIFVLLSPRFYFSEEELELLLNECSSLKHALILIDNREHAKIQCIDQHVLIDMDNCEVF